MTKKVSYAGLNLGSGSIGPTNWVNIDSDVFFTINGHLILRSILKPFLRILDQYSKSWLSKSFPPSNYVRVRLDKGRLPFPDNSIKYVYTSHFLEHLQIWETTMLLKEVKRVLTDKGIVRIVVPDLELIAKAYVSWISGRTQEFSALKVPSRFNTPVEVMNFYFGNFNEDSLSQVPKILRNRATKYGKKRGHKYMYDFEKLRSVLDECGFSSIEKYSYRKGTLPDLELLDLESHKPYSLYIEAQK